MFRKGDVAMGRWGDEPFQNDAALDFLNDCLDYVKRRIQEALTDDDYPDPPVLAAVCCLRAILEKIAPARRLLSAEEVSDWKKKYLLFIENISDDEDQSNRDRRIAEQEFDALFECVESN